MNKCAFCGTRGVVAAGESNCRNCGANPSSQKSEGIIPRLILAVDIAKNWGATEPNIEIIKCYEQAGISLSNDDLDVARNFRLKTTLSNSLWFWYSNGLQMAAAFVGLLVASFATIASTAAFQDLQTERLVEEFGGFRLSLASDVESLKGEIEVVRDSIKHSHLSGVDVLLREVNTDIQIADNALSRTSQFSELPVSDVVNNIDSRDRIKEGLGWLKASTVSITSHEPIEQVERSRKLHNKLEGILDQLADLSGNTELVNSRDRYHKATVGHLEEFDLDSANTSIGELQQVSVRHVNIKTARVQTVPRLDHLASISASDRASDSVADARRKFETALSRSGKGLDDVNELIRHLESILNDSYELRIVNRPGVSSGVWRHPNDNPIERSYYLVVESLLDPSQKRFILNEETLQYDLVDHWAIRVSQDIFEKVKQDKVEDGIVDDDYVGKKTAGYLVPDYAIPTTGGTITKW